jgi:hypothetical protein
MTAARTDAPAATSPEVGEPPQPVAAPVDASTELAASSLAAVWHRIHDHKVMHWTLAYAAAAYTLLHGMEMVSGALSWPHMIVRALTLVLILGVPVAITVAWYHGAKGLHKINAPELVIITFLGIIAGSVLWGMTTTGEHAPVVGAEARRSRWQPRDGGPPSPRPPKSARMR